MPKYTSACWVELACVLATAFVGTATPGRLIPSPVSTWLYAVARASSARPCLAKEAFNARKLNSWEALAFSSCSFNEPESPANTLEPSGSGRSPFIILLCSFQVKRAFKKDIFSVSSDEYPIAHTKLRRNGIFPTGTTEPNNSKTKKTAATMRTFLERARFLTSCHNSGKVFISSSCSVGLFGSAIISRKKAGTAHGPAYKFYLSFIISVPTFLN